MSLMVDDQREGDAPEHAPAAAQIAELSQLSLKTLRREYRAIIGREAPPWSHRTTLFAKLAWAIQAREFGGLSVTTLATIERLAQDPSLGLYAELPVPTDAAAPPRSETRVFRIGRRLDRRVPLPGTVITRAYRGGTVAVKVLADGFEHEGARFRTLSAVAKKVTGQHMSGLRFFGFAPRKDEEAKGRKP